LSHVGDAIVFTNLHGTILYVNPAWEQVTGYRIEESVGRPLDAAGMEDVWAQVQAGAIWQGILRAIGKSGAEYDAEWIFAPVRDLQGRIHRVVGVLRDVTEAQQVEALKARFIADAAHDLRRPLATLRLRTDLLERDPEQAARHVTSIQYQIGRLETLVSDLLTLSELDRKAPDEPAELVDLVDVVAQVVAAYELVVQQANLVLHVEAPPVTVPVVGAEDQLVRVVENLLANAINYTPPGGWVRLRLVRQRDRATFTVHDSGIGIPPDALPHIFERFYRADNARTQAEGTGLGMSIVHAIVTLYGGTIRVASTPGEGTRFDVELPAATAVSVV
jgi:PAS domain S-box-containing protein